MLNVLLSCHRRDRDEVEKFPRAPLDRHSKDANYPAIRILPPGADPAVDFLSRSTGCDHFAKDDSSFFGRGRFTENSSMRQPHMRRLDELANYPSVLPVDTHEASRRNQTHRGSRPIL